MVVMVGSFRTGPGMLELMRTMVVKGGGTFAVGWDDKYISPAGGVKDDDDDDNNDDNDNDDDDNDDDDHENDPDRRPGRGDGRNRSPPRSSSGEVVVVVDPEGKRSRWEEKELKELHQGGRVPVRVYTWVMASVLGGRRRVTHDDESFAWMAST